MKSQDTPFVGGPLDGRVLPVLLGITGHPPKTYRIPVPDAAGGPPTVLVYRRVDAGRGGFMHQLWKYEYAPDADPGRRLKWPWSKPNGATGPDTRDTPDGQSATPPAKPRPTDE
ncbi:hypothetical protein [Streptomyces sp. DSM 40750]|uniref:hypothetical protein n=1 Tax=Streptomyces sp. DSM 40750 TaxID=2801030 RepID=UPI00214C029D|nr:hypothetical protein [Streptomyces sp. DSM 40750]UUU24894.1 hypothetical protein JIX55_34150 [Streptomyces sp. DSM 40750]